MHFTLSEMWTFITVLSLFMYICTYQCIIVIVTIVQLYLRWIWMNEWLQCYTTAEILINNSAQNETIRDNTGQDMLEVIVRKRRSRWFGHVQWMEDSRRAKQALEWIPDEKKKRGRSHHLERHSLEGCWMHEHDMGGRLPRGNRQKRMERMDCPMCSKHRKD